RLSGLSEEDIKIEFTGLRPGEKLFEELLSDRESTLPTPHPKLRIARAGTPPGGDAWLTELESWISPEQAPADDEVRRELAKRVPEYRPVAHGAHGSRLAKDDGRRRFVSP